MRLTLSKNILFIYSALAIGVGGCGDTVQPPFELAGSWADNFGSYALVTNDSWGDAAIIEFDNDANIAILQNAADAAYNPSAFSKITWIDSDTEGFWMCTLEFGKSTAAQARDGTTTADPSDPATSGCGGFSWTKFFTPLEIEGQWMQAPNTTVNISSVLWGEDTLVSFSNENNIAITQNPSTAESNPGTFNKIVWTEPESGSFWYCTIDSGKNTAEDANNSSNSADASTPSASGCGGDSWTKLSTSSN